jgi:hypothetical protein
MRAPTSNHRDLRVIDALDAHVNVLPCVRRVRSADDFVLAGFVGESGAKLEVHRQHTLRLRLRPTMDPHEGATSVWYRIAGLLQKKEIAIDIIEGEIRSAK